MIRNLRFRKETPDGFSADKLAKMLEDAYLGQRREDKHTTKKTFSPSSIGYGHARCARYWYLAFEGNEFIETTDAIGVANMANGTLAHERIQGLFRETGILEEEELEITMEDPPIRGFADVVILWEGESVIGEIKTTRQESFEFRRTSMKPSANHLLQILIYMKATGKKTGFLLYENKNTQEFIVIPVRMTPKNEKTLENALTWLREVRKAWEDQTLPARPVKRRDSVVCKQCPVYNVCWNETEDGELKIPLMEVEKA
jgi:CRISPR/Cas system-associated exonuclease Cas4 (RecB family)